MMLAALETHDVKPTVVVRQPPMPPVVSVPFGIETPTTVQTSTDTAQISGQITGGGKIVTLTVDSSAVPVSSDGAFDFQRLVPIGETELLLSAKNEWAQTVEARVMVVRTPYVSAQAAYAPLDPSRLQGLPRPEAIALIIGIDQYQNAPPADFAENDARAFYDYAARGLGVPGDRIKILTGQNARRLDVQKAVQTWLEPLIAKGRSDVFVFFSGHGLASEDSKDLYLLPYDGEVSMLNESSIRRKEFIDAIVKAGAASVTMVLDTCYSGGTRGNGPSLMALTRPVMVTAKEPPVAANVTILAAAANNQLSNALAPAKHGLFSYFVMKGLEGDAAGPDHIITAARLEQYLMEHVPAEAAKLGRNQTPQIIGDGERIIERW